MPEMQFDIVWPDGTTARCYSPSLVIKDYFEPGSTYDLADFLQRSRTALEIASDRVRQKFGFPCSRAQSQLAALEAGCARFSGTENAQVRVATFHE